MSSKISIDWIPELYDNKMMDLGSIDMVENRRRMERGELYYAFTPDLIADRRQCLHARDNFNTASGLATRRTMAELWQR